MGTARHAVGMGCGRGSSGFLRALHAELLKLRSYPVMWVTLGLTVSISMLAGAYLTHTALVHPENAGGLTPTSAYQYVFSVSRLGFVLVGCLLLRVEEGTGLASSLLAVPRRGRLLAAKIAATVVITLPASLASAGGAYAARTVALVVHGISAAPTDADLPQLALLVTWWVELALLVLCASVCVRRSLPVMAVTIAMLLMLSSILCTITKLANWLPDQLVSGLLRSLSRGEGVELAPIAAMVAWLAVVYAGARVSIARWGV